MEFEKHYRRDEAATATGANVAILDKIEPHAMGLKSFCSEYSGATFNGGLYRIFRVDEFSKWTALATEMYPELKGKMLVFASDWRGQFYAINATRKDGDQYQIQLLDPATGESLGIPATFESFHEAELVEYPNDSLQAELFSEWMQAKGVAPRANECVGYIKPLRLGGLDEKDNQEITDLEVYWALSSQIHQQIAGLPEGTKIDKVDLE